MMNPVRVAFDKPIVQRSKPLNGLLDIIAFATMTNAKDLPTSHYDDYSVVFN